MAKQCEQHPDGRLSNDGRCVTCESKRRAEYRARNLERERARRLAYRERERELDKARREANPEQSRERVRRYRERHPDRVKANNAAQYAKDPAENRARTQRWRQENPEKVRAKQKAWESANPEKVARWRSESVAKWRAKYPERRAHYVRQYQMQKRQAIPPWADRRAILAFYQEARRLTEKTGIVHHVDHIIPINHPLVCGLHVETNLQVIPAADNARKSNHLPPLGT
jgi:hypothetical protein